MEMEANKHQEPNHGSNLKKANLIALLLYSVVNLLILPALLFTKALEYFSQDGYFIVVNGPAILYGLVRWLTFYRISNEKRLFLIASLLLDLVLVIGLPALVLITQNFQIHQSWYELFWTEEFIFHSSYEVLSYFLYMFLSLFFPIWCVFSSGETTNKAAEGKVKILLLIYLAAVLVFMIYYFFFWEPQALVFSKITPQAGMQ